VARTETTKIPALQVPQSREELNDRVAQVGGLQRRLQTIGAKLNRQVAAAQARAAEEVSPLEQRLDELVNGIDAYCQSHRDELTNDGKKRIVKLPSGEVGWRLTPPAVTLPDNVKAFLALLKQLGLYHFIRTKEEVDKQAMLKEPETAETIEGVTIGQREEFIIKPVELQVSIVAAVK